MNTIARRRVRLHGNPWGLAHLVMLASCAQQPQPSAAATDCDEGAPEVCNGIDDNCDGNVDEGLAATAWYPDADGDGFGDAEHRIDACAPPPDTVPTAGDCDDGDAAISPAAVDFCDGVDDDCSGDESGLVTFEGVDGVRTDLPSRASSRRCRRCPEAAPAPRSPPAPTSTSRSATSR